MIGGMDEAGRGPAIGPIVFGLVVLTKEQETILKEKGVNDSKKLSKANREQFKQIIDETVEISETLAVSASEIDQLRHEMTMNEIEVLSFRKILSKHADKIEELQLDAADVNAERFGKNFTDLIDGNIDSRHKGDSIFTSVGAASILAKVERDMKVQDLQVQIDAMDADLPSFGSGYPVQAKPFLEAYVKKYQTLPDIARKTWKTSKDALEKFGLIQRELSDYF